MTTKIKCACKREDCESTIEIWDSGYMFVYERAGIYHTSATFDLPRPIAKAIREACKVMDENDVD